MDDFDDIKKAISKKTTRMVGYEIQGLSDILSLLTGPDVLPLLEDLIQTAKKEQ